MFFNIEELQDNQNLKTALTRAAEQRFRNFVPQVVGHVIEIFNIVLFYLSLNPAEADIESMLAFLGFLMPLLEYNEVAAFFN